MDNSYWFSDEIPAGIDPHDDQIINGASSGMTRYKALYVEAAENMIDPNIYYDINEYGYRCPPFETIDHDKIQVITAGCSFTFGIGVSEGNYWSSILQQKLPSSFQVWNLGLPGYSNDAIVRIISAFVKFIKPAFIFVQWTHFNRREYVRSNNTLHGLLCYKVC